MANRRSTAAPGSTRKSIFGHSYLSTPGWSPVLRRQKRYEDESNVLETPDISQLMAQTPLRGLKSLKSGSGWDDSMDGTVDEMGPHTPPRGCFGHDDDIDQEGDGSEEEDGSFVEVDTVLGVPPRGGPDGEDEYGEEDELGEEGGIILPKVLDFTTVRKGADSPDENEDHQPLPNSATSASQLHPVNKSPGASASLPKVDIPLERFVVGLAQAPLNQSDSPLDQTLEQCWRYIGSRPQLQCRKRGWHQSAPKRFRNDVCTYLLCSYLVVH